MTMQDHEARLRQEINDLGEQLSDFLNLAAALEVVIWDFQQGDLPQNMHQHRDALVGISNAMQRMSENVS